MRKILYAAAMLLGVSALCATPTEAQVQKVSVVQCIGTLFTVRSDRGIFKYVENNDARCWLQWTAGAAPEASKEPFPCEDKGSCAVLGFVVHYGFPFTPPVSIKPPRKIVWLSHLIEASRVPENE